MRIRQRGIVGPRDRTIARKTGDRDLDRAVKERVDVLRPAFERLIAREMLHPVDERGDPIDLVDDQLGEWPRRLARIAFQQLRGAANAREWVLDLMSQHRRRARRRASAKRGATHPHRLGLPMHV